MTVAHRWQLTVDCADPHGMAAFWAAALHYTVEQHEEFIKGLLADGVINEDYLTEVDGAKAWKTAAAVRHPDDPVHDNGAGKGQRLLFLQVPEPKQVKNRLHVDISVGPQQRDAEVDRLTGLGATVVRRVEEPGSHHVLMHDVEGNEFCVQ